MKNFAASIQKIAIKYQLNLPTSATKDDIIVKKVYMVDYESCVIHFYNNHKKRQYLTYTSLKGQIKCIPLRYDSSVKQHTKLKFLVLHHDDFSVDEIEMIKGKWKITKIRQPQRILIKQVESILILFRLSGNFCVIEKYPQKLQKLFFFINNQGQYRREEELTLESKHKIMKLNQTSLLGWLQTRQSFSKQIMHYIHLINFASPHFKQIEIPIHAPAYEAKENGNNQSLGSFQITHVTELTQDIYICRCTYSSPLDYWIFDTNKLFEPQCIQIITNDFQKNRNLFDYNSYLTKTFGFFRVTRARNISTTRLDRQQKVSICLKTGQSIHNPNVCMYSYNWKTEINDNIIIEIMAQVKLKDVYMQMLLHIEDDFDDDLLLDAIRITVK